MKKVNHAKGLIYIIITMFLKKGEEVERRCDQVFVHTSIGSYK
jgi:hypothetical protein